MGFYKTYNKLENHSDALMGGQLCINTHERVHARRMHPPSPPSCHRFRLSRSLPCADPSESLVAHVRGSQARDSDASGRSCPRNRLISHLI
mmetsp:Transcript_15977/g.43245  ORF Transcript_15977/g.43245 Transcript_15977/m.43245 type:complete len:91 (-) Transcript_15977:314-586(-)